MVLWQMTVLLYLWSLVFLPGLSPQDLTIHVAIEPILFGPGFYTVPFMCESNGGWGYLYPNHDGHGVYCMVWD
jgi:hypothetical protein